MNKVERCALPVIALLHGYTLGLGLELVMASDFRLAAEGTLLGLPEARLGLIPDVGGSTRLARLVGPAHAKELILSGRSINAELAARWGLVNDVVPSGDLYNQGQALVTEISRCAPRAVSLAKRVINEGYDLERGLQLEAWAQSQLVQMEDFQVGIQAMLTKTSPQWRNR
jgi:enoyl-CoA hydratase/carnithine racemase